MTAPESRTGSDTASVGDSEENPVRDAAARGVTGALARYRVLAYVVGVGLLALVASMIMEYVFDQPQYTAIVGPVHGFVYAVYLVLAVDLAIKARWSAKGTILVLVAGMVPFVSFFAERRVTHRVREGRAL
jgi:integral membrane protein